MWVILGEFFTIVLVLFIWCPWVGVKVQCPQCRVRYYHYRGACPACGLKLGEPPVKVVDMPFVLPAEELPANKSPAQEESPTNESPTEK